MMTQFAVEGVSSPTAGEQPFQEQLKQHVQRTYVPFGAATDLERGRQGDAAVLETEGQCSAAACRAVRQIVDSGTRSHPAVDGAAQEMQGMPKRIWQALQV
jgi:hypothetical protein